MQCVDWIENDSMHHRFRIMCLWKDVVARHGKSEEQIYYHNSTQGRDARKGQTDQVILYMIFDQLFKGPKYHETKEKLGWTEDECKEVDELAQEDHTYKLTKSAHFTRDFFICIAMCSYLLFGSRRVWVQELGCAQNSLSHLHVSLMMLHEYSLGTSLTPTSTSVSPSWTTPWSSISIPGASCYDTCASNTRNVDYGSLAKTDTLTGYEPNLLDTSEEFEQPWRAHTSNKSTTLASTERSPPMRKLTTSTAEQRLLHHLHTGDRSRRQSGTNLSLEWRKFAERCAVSFSKHGATRRLADLRDKEAAVRDRALRENRCGRCHEMEALKKTHEMRVDECSKEKFDWKSQHHQRAHGQSAGIAIWDQLYEWFKRFLKMPNRCAINHCCLTFPLNQRYFFPKLIKKRLLSRARNLQPDIRKKQGTSGHLVPKYPTHAMTQLRGGFLWGQARGNPSLKVVIETKTHFRHRDF